MKDDTQKKQPIRFDFPPGASAVAGGATSDRHRGEH
jgi:hypothetical protein